MSARSARPVVAVAVSLGLLLAACGGDSSDSETEDTSTPAGDEAQGLMEPGTLVVGMNLQYKPQMYLEDGEPSGYDVDLLNLLADDLGVDLEIENLDFNGLIPGLQSKQFDLVSVGLGATDERKQVIDFSRGYVPYATILAAELSSEFDGTTDTLNQEGVRITALQGSTSEMLIAETFPEAEVASFPDQNAALLEVATGRADATVVEDYILAEFDRSNPGRLEVVDMEEPLSLYYGSWGVQKGNSELTAKLDEFLCEVETDGTLEELYTKWMAPEMPAMPGGC